jgi:hypothetical protein
VQWGEYGITPNLTSKMPASGPRSAGSVSPSAAIIQIQSVQFSAKHAEPDHFLLDVLVASAVLVCLTGVPMFRRIRSGRRVARNLCATCGYDRAPRRPLPRVRHADHARSNGVGGDVS